MPEVVGTAILGERGQIVIPKSARDKMHLSKGEQMIVINHESSLLLVPTKQMKGIIRHMTKTIDHLSKTL